MVRSGQIYVCMYVYLERERERERERARMHAEEEQRGRERILSSLFAVSAEADAGFQLTNREIMA